MNTLSYKKRELIEIKRLVLFLCGDFPKITP